MNRDPLARDGREDGPPLDGDLRLRVGYRTVDVSVPAQTAVMPVRVFYPTRCDEGLTQVGPYCFRAAVGAPVEGNHLPLVVVSHGGGGSGLTYRDLARHLASAGFVVLLPDHPGDNRTDKSLSGTLANLEHRPRHVRAAIDAGYADDMLGPRLSREKVAVIGHSMGGYTALAVAGGRPQAGPQETPDGRIRAVAVARDHRVRGLVLLAPACGWYWSAEALADIDVPVLLLTAEKDDLAAQLHVHHLERLADSGRLRHRVVPLAGHHAFQSPFPASMVRPDFPPALDPAGFDRAGFQPILAGEILAFLRAL